MSRVAADRFESAYTRSLLPAAAAKLSARRTIRGQAGVAPSQAWALGGAVILPDRALAHGWVTVEGATVAGVSESKPTHARALETGGVILPGLIDLHGHPEWNVFAAWEPPRLYPN